MCGDLFAQMRSVVTVQRAGINERRLAGEENLPPVLSSQDVLEFATIEGAIANGLDHKVGSLRPGKEADIIMLTDRPRERDADQHTTGKIFSRQGPSFTTIPSGRGSAR